jgi:hydrogenase-4 component E
MQGLTSLSYDTAHVLDTGVLVLSFALLYQRRLFGVIKIYALQALLLAAAAAWQAWAQDAPHLYITAGIALVFKAIVIPIALHRIIVRLNIHRTIETALGVGATMVVGVALVALSILLGLLVMIARRNAVSQVVGFMSLENGLILAAVGVKGMPLVVELSIAFSVMVAFIIFGVFFFHIRERFDTLDVHDIERFRGERG